MMKEISNLPRNISLPLKKVVEGGSRIKKVLAEKVPLFNSGFMNGMPTTQAKEAMIQWAEKKTMEIEPFSISLRDWLFSRQRYWGEPFPIIHLENGAKKPLPE